MKKFLLAALVAASAATAVASSANAMPMHHGRHHVCTFRHHHRVCYWR